MEFKCVLLHIAIVFYAADIKVAHSQSAGDSCIFQRDGTPGTCKLLLNCPAAIQGFKTQQAPQICKVSGTVAIVCCPTARSATVGTKSRQKCKEYAKLAYTTYRSPGLAIGGPRWESRLQCSFKKVPLIVGGKKADPKEFPHSAAIGYDNAEGPGRVYHCGGSLISENFVLTAGHCLSNQIHGIAKYVRLGDLNLARTDDDAQPQEYDIAQFVRHPDFRPPSKYNDILLIRLSQNVRFNHYVRPLCLYIEQQPPTRSAIASGWGVTEHSKDKISDDLLKVTLDFASQADCSNLYPRSKRKLPNGIIQSQICAGSRKVLGDTCQGDSGGPLQIFHNEEECMYSLVGITSFGKVCGATSAPAVYTRVSHFIDWIEQTVWP